MLHLSSVLVPYLMSPGWLIGNVNTAYHVVLAVGAISFSAAVFPAYALARRLGITPRGAVVVALLAVLVPDAALATNAMTEPYAYPIFLVTLLVAIDAIVSPTLVRQLGVLSLMGVLCLARVQFGFVLVLYLLAALIHERSLRRLARRQPVVTAVIVGALAVVAVIRPSKLVGFYSFPTQLVATLHDLGLARSQPIRRQFRGRLGRLSGCGDRLSGGSCGPAIPRAGHSRSSPSAARWLWGCRRRDTSTRSSIAFTSDTSSTSCL